MICQEFDPVTGQKVVRQLATLLRAGRSSTSMTGADMSMSSLVTAVPATVIENKSPSPSLVLQPTSGRSSSAETGATVEGQSRPEFESASLAGNSNDSLVSDVKPMTKL